MNFALVKDQISTPVDDETTLAIVEWWLAKRFGTEVASTPPTQGITNRDYEWKSDGQWNGLTLTVPTPIKKASANNKRSKALKAYWAKKRKAARGGK